MTQLVFRQEQLELIISKLLNKNIKYNLGSKILNLKDTSPEKFKFLDCSGFTQYVIYKTTLSNLRIPQGSSNQITFFENNGYPEVTYKNETSKSDNLVSIAFRNTIMKKNEEGNLIKKKNRKGFEREQVGHVWLIINGKTCESTGKKGYDGPATLQWDARTGDADRCFILGSIIRFSPYLTKLERTC